MMDGASAKRSLAIAAAGLAAVIGVATLQKQRQSGAPPAPAKSDAAKNAGLSGALLRLQVPSDWREVVKNDVFLDKTIAAAADRLFIFVTGPTRHEVVNYMSQLYNLTWDVACLKGKHELDVRIIAGVADKGVPSWDDLVRLPEIQAVFDSGHSLTADEVNALRSGLEPVVFHPLGAATAAYFRDDLHYFENQATSLEAHRVVMLGGTFDHLHNGHKKLLSLAVAISSTRLIVGITSDAMLVKKKHADLIDSLATREANVRAYVAFLKPSLHVEFTVLSDPFGPAIVVDDDDAAIVVSTETIAAVPTIQDLRAAKNLPPLKVFICRRTDGSTLSSSFIRERLAARRAAAGDDSRRR